MGLPERLLQAAEEGERMGSVIEILVLQALAHRAQAHIPHALDPLERALTPAEPEGYVRIFVDEGEPMRDLLRHAATGGIGGSYTRRLLSALNEPVQPISTPAHTPEGELVEPLTSRDVRLRFYPLPQGIR